MKLTPKDYMRLRVALTIAISLRELKHPKPYEALLKKLEKL